MSSPSERRLAAAVAFRHFDAKDTTNAEREAILVVMVDDVGGHEGELASRLLHHRRESATLQLEMRALLDGIGGSDAANDDGGHAN